MRTEAVKSLPVIHRVTLNQSDLAPVTPTCIYAYKAELCGHRTYITKTFHERICSFKILLLLTAALHRLKMLWKVVFRSFSSQQELWGGVVLVPVAAL